MPTCTPWASSQDLSWARYKLWQAVRYVHAAPVLLRGPAVNVFVVSADICHRADEVMQVVRVMLAERRAQHVNFTEAMFG